MKKNTWTWSIGCQNKKYYVYLMKGTVLQENLAAIGGWLLNRRFYWCYRVGDWLIKKYCLWDEVMKLEITYEQAVDLGWELEQW